MICGMTSRYVRPVRRLLLFLLLMACATVATADITISVGAPIISSPDRGFPSYFEEQLKRGAARAELDLTELIGERATIAVGGRASRADFTVSPIVSDSPEYSALILTMTDARSGRTSEPFNYTAGWDDNLHRSISKALVFLYLSVAGGPDTGVAEPVFLAEVSMTPLSTVDIGFDGQIYPYGLATDSHGDLLVAGNATVVRFDRYFREQAKLAPPPQANQYSWAGRIAVSPADMVYTQAIAGGDIWAFAPGLAEARRIRTGQSSVASLAVMEDGSVILHDQVNQSTVRIRDGQRQPLNLKSGQYSYIFAITGGPDNTVWTWDTTTRMAVVSDPNGFEIDVIIPVLPMSEGVMVRAMAPYPGGDLLLATPTMLYRVNPDGLVVWSFSLQDHPEIGPLQSMGAVAFDAENGLIYLNEPTQQRVIQILDVAYARQTRSLTEVEGELIRLSERLRRSPGDTEALVRRAELFEQMEAWLPALQSWIAAAASDPADAGIAAGAERMEIMLDTLAARKAAARARLTAERIGMATARSDYFNALALYEQLLARNPGNRELAGEMDRLIEEFEQPMRPRERNPFPLTVSVVQLNDVFPSLSLYYRSNALGSVTLRNDLEIPVTGVTVTLEMSVMDFPTRSEPVGELGPGESATVPL